MDPGSQADAHLDGRPVVDVEGDQLQRGSVALREPLQRGCRLRLPRGSHHVIAGREHLSQIEQHTYTFVPDGSPCLALVGEQRPDRQRLLRRRARRAYPGVCCKLASHVIV